VSNDWFDRVLLEDDQRLLLDLMVEADNTVAKQARTSFILVQTSGGDFLIRDGMPRDWISLPDLATLVERGLVREHYGSEGNRLYDVRPEGRLYWAEMKRRGGEPVQVVEAEVRAYLDAEAFAVAFRQAYNRWSQAAAELWGADSADRFTDIGHRCREAMQYFATALIEQAGVDANEQLGDPARTVDRIRRVIAHRGELGGARRAFLVALVDYWGTVSDLVQRQEHGATKEGEQLTWEDARRVVFQTAIVMFEVARAVGLPAG
jgi:hypothetical protein